MADYLRQLGNDEKRCPSAVVATVAGADIVGPLATTDLAVATIPANSALGRVYVVVTEAFAAGSTLDFGVTGLPTNFLTGLDLATVGASRSQVLHGSVNPADLLAIITPNANAIASTVGEVKLVIELTETNLKAGMYTA